jgi:hypothetical protein
MIAFFRIIKNKCVHMHMTPSPARNSDLLCLVDAAFDDGHENQSVPFYNYHWHKLYQYVLPNSVLHLFSGRYICFRYVTGHVSMDFGGGGVVRCRDWWFLWFWLMRWQWVFFVVVE